MNQEIENKYKLLHESIRLLTLSLEEQKQTLPDFVDIYEDLISSFDDSFLLLSSIVKSEILSYNSIAAILDLNNHINWCLRNDLLLGQNSFEWDRIRILAKNAFHSLGPI